MILDLEVSVSTIEIFIEDRYVSFILKYFKTFQLISHQEEVYQQKYVSEDLIPILTNISTIKNHITFRTFKITPIQLILNLHWSTVCFISMNCSRLKFAELQKNNMTTSLHQLGQLISIHYFDGLISNVGNALSSLELIGAPGNFIFMMKKGISDFSLNLKQGWEKGPIQSLFGFARGSNLFTKYLSLGVLLSVLSITKSWSKTFNNVKSLKHITKLVVQILKIIEKSTAICIKFIDSDNDVKTLLQ